MLEFKQKHLRFKENVFICRKNRKNGCKDVSVSNCLDDERYLLKEIDWLESIELCQYYCRLVHNCLMFRFDGKNCRLLRKDTNKECSIIGGPPVIYRYRAISFIYKSVDNSLKPVKLYLKLPFSF